jgi:hypothetical protein
VTNAVKKELWFVFWEKEGPPDRRIGRAFFGVDDISLWAAFVCMDVWKIYLTN